RQPHQLGQRSAGHAAGERHAEPRRHARRSPQHRRLPGEPAVVATRRSPARRPGVVYRLGHWVDERIGAAHFARTALDKIFPDHSSFMLGEIAMYCFVILILTGICLTLFFRPSPHEVVCHGSYGPLRGERLSGAYQWTI